MIKVLITCFFAREDTKTPLYISVVSVLINIIFSLLLIGTMREMGIALATAISAWVNVLFLFFILLIRKDLVLDSIILKNSLKIIVSVFVMLIFCYFLNILIFGNLYTLGFIEKIGSLVFVIIFCKIIYLVMIFMLKVISFDNLRGI